MDMNLRELAKLDRIESRPDDSFLTSFWKFVGILADQLGPHVPHIHQTISKGETGRIARHRAKLAPNTTRVHRPVPVRPSRGSTRLREMEGPSQMVAGHDPKTQWFARIGSHEIWIVGMESVHRFGLKADLVDAIDGHPFGKSMNWCVGPFVLVGSHHIVERQVLETIGSAMDLIDFRLLIEAVSKVPRLLARAFLWPHGLGNHSTGRIEIASEQVARGDERLANIVEVFGGLIAREMIGRIKHDGVQMQEIAHRVSVFSCVDPSQDGLATRSLVGLMVLIKPCGQPIDDRTPIVFGWLLGVIGWHLAKIQLVNHILVVNEHFVAVDGAGKQVKATISLLFIRTMTVRTVLPKERLNLELETNLIGGGRLSLAL